jgi:hypothetical protein
VGDFNAEVGKEYGFEQNVGKYSLHKEKDDNGWRMIDFARARSITVSSTFFQHKSIHLQTWRSPDGLSANQIDHVMNLVMPLTLQMSNHVQELNVIAIIT